jgi:hypothetical protein
VSSIDSCDALSALVRDMTSEEFPLGKSSRVGFGPSGSQHIVKGGAIPKLIALLQRTFAVANFRGT